MFHRFLYVYQREAVWLFDSFCCVKLPQLPNGPAWADAPAAAFLLLLVYGMVYLLKD
jgi:hypothetical protein